jgi:hypothetical protein
MFLRFVRKQRQAWIRNVEIKRVSAALKRHEAAIREMDEEWARLDGVCCPGCMFGERHSKACDKAERTRAWLVVLLRRRGTLADMRWAKALESW